MPIYEYECQRCRHRFELIQKVSDTPVDSCPKCQGEVQKLLSAPGLQFKGSGWYITDYSRKNAPKDETKIKPASTESGGEGAKTPPAAKPSSTPPSTESK